MDRDKLAEKLQSIDLTEYQSRAYIGAVALGEATPTVLAEETDVPQPRIYDVVASLEERGLVEVHTRSGEKEVTAIDPGMALPALKRRHFSDFEETIQSLNTDLSGLYAGEQSAEGFISMVKREDSALRHIRNAIEDADWWLTLAISPDVYEKVEDDLVAAIDRGATVRVILGDQDGYDEFDFPSTMRVRHRGISDTLVVADRSYGIFSSTYPSPTEQPWIIAQETNLVLMYQIYYEQIWTTSAVLQSGDDKPQWYIDPWRVIIDLRDELLTDDLELRIIGHRSEDRYKGEWTATVVDYEMTGPVDDPFESALPVVATLKVDTGDEILTVGGWKATVEDIAAHAIEVRR